MVSMVTGEFNARYISRWIHSSIDYKHTRNKPYHQKTMEYDNILKTNLSLSVSLMPDDG